MSSVFEIGIIFVENVIIKVCYVVKEIGLFVIVDDFGLVVDLLGGVLGIYLLCFVGEFVLDDDNIIKLFEVLGDDN